MENLVHIHLLGLPHILLGRSQVQDFPAEKVKLLFFYLVLFRKVAHTRSELASLLWGDWPEARARHSLNNAVSRLRHWLEPLHTGTAPFLLMEDQQIAFNAASRYWLDTAEFEDRIRWAKQMNVAAPDQAAAALDRAVKLYRGELLEGCYTDWCLAERDRLQQLFYQALEYLMVYHSGRREYPQAITFAQRLLRDDPLREDIQRELMKLFALNQQPAEAILQYRRCETVLREELGITPMPETEDIFRRLIPGSAAPIVSTMPVSGALHANGVQLKPLIQTIDAALTQLEVARAGLAEASQALHNISDGGLSKADDSQTR